MNRKNFRRLKIGVLSLTGNSRLNETVCTGNYVIFLDADAIFICDGWTCIFTIRYSSCTYMHHHQPGI